jgi:hypothetical protein
MAVTLRSGLNRQMTHREMDENFTVLRSMAPPTTVDVSGTEYTNSNRGRWKAIVSAAPSSLGDHSSVVTAFSGDISKIQLPVEHRITGTDTLGQPTSGYLYTPEAYPHYTYLYNASGYNHSTSGNDGRTAAVGHSIRAYQTGAGDLIPFQSNTYVTATGNKVGATSFLANAAGSVVCGGVEAGGDGVFLQPSEFVLRDNGYDVAGVGPTVSMYRTNSTGALDAFWVGFRSQSKGTQNVDVAFSVFGPHSIGLDMTTATIGQAAITLKADQKIYGNATAADYRKASSFPNDYISYQSNISGWGIVVGGAAVIQATQTQVAVAGGANLLIASTGVFKVAGSNQATTGTSSATFTATNKPGATSGATPALWLRVDVNGVAHYAPLWVA